MKFITRYNLTRKLYNSVVFHLKIKKIDILPFVINTPIDNLNNKKVSQQFDNLDIFRFNDGIYFSDIIIRYFFLWIKYQSAKIECLNSQYFHDEESIKITQKLKVIKDNFSKDNLIFIPHQYGVHW